MQDSMESDHHLARIGDGNLNDFQFIEKLASLNSELFDVVRSTRLRKGFNTGKLPSFPVVTPLTENIHAGINSGIPASLRLKVQKDLEENQFKNFNVYDPAELLRGNVLTNNKFDNEKFYTLTKYVKKDKLSPDRFVSGDDKLSKPTIISHRLDPSSMWHEMGHGAIRFSEPNNLRDLSGTKIQPSRVIPEFINTLYGKDKNAHSLMKALYYKNDDRVQEEFLSNAIAHKKVKDAFGEDAANRLNYIFTRSMLSYGVDKDPQAVKAQVDRVSRDYVKRYTRRHGKPPKGLEWVLDDNK